MDRGIASAARAVLRGSGTAIVTSSPARTTWERRAGAPRTRTAPSSISLWMRDRERSEQAPARKRSRRVPAEGAPTWKRRTRVADAPSINSLRFGAVPPREDEQHGAREER